MLQLPRRGFDGQAWLPHRRLAVEFLSLLTFVWLLLWLHSAVRSEWHTLRETSVWVTGLIAMTMLALSRRHARVFPVALITSLMSCCASMSFWHGVSVQASPAQVLGLTSAMLLGPMLCCVVLPLPFAAVVMLGELVWAHNTAASVSGWFSSPVHVTLPLALVYALQLLVARQYRRFQQEASATVESLEKARDQALESARVKAQFIATLSHELRTPLNGVLGLTQLLIDSPLTAAQREWTRAAHASGALMLTLANQVLDLSGLESGKVVPAQECFELPALLEQVVRVCGVATRPGVDLLCHVHPGVPQRVVGDPARLQQVLINLVGNAQKFTEHGAIRLLAWAECVLPPAGRAVFSRRANRNAVTDTGTSTSTAAQSRSVDASDSEAAEAAGTAPNAPVRLCFVVADTGPGMPASLVERLFEPFVQGQHKRGGAGLGLPIARQLVRAMQGDIVVRSELGHGSEFAVDIVCRLPPDGWEPVGIGPRAATAAGGEAADTTGAGVGADTAVRLGSVAVLSGSPQVRTFCRAVLHQTGLPVAAPPLSVADGAEAAAVERALDALGAETLPDPLLLLADGVPVAEAVTRALPATPVCGARLLVLLHPRENAEFVRRVQGKPGGGSGAQALYKPLMSARLVEAVLAACSTADAPVGSAAPSLPQPQLLLSPLSPLPPPPSATVAPSAAAAPELPLGALDSSLPAPLPPPSPGADIGDDRQGARTGRLHDQHDAAAGAAVRVLVAEDVAVNQLVMRKLLARLGVRADLVENGAAAVEAVARHPPGYYAACLMDTHMPGMDGLAAARAIRRLEAEKRPGEQPLRIIAVTAAVHPENAQACRDAGMDGFVSKPVFEEQIRKALHL